MNGPAAVAALDAAGVKLTDEQREDDRGDKLLELLTRLGVGARQGVVVAPAILDDIEDLLDRIKVLRPGSPTRMKAYENLAALRRHALAQAS